MVVMYADTITPSMRRAIDETERRRTKQDAFNKAHGIVPKTVKKSVRELLEISKSADLSRGPEDVQLTKQQRLERIAKLEKEMKEAAKMLEFELAAALRDQIISYGERKRNEPPLPRAAGPRRMARKIGAKRRFA